MSLLIINTLPEDDAEAVKAIEKLSETTDKVKIVNTCEMNIMHCTGCNKCMIENPGVCCLNDDYNDIARLFFKYDNIIFIADTEMNFLSYKAMRFFERRYCFVIVYSEWRNGQIRHPSRYSKEFNIGVLYKGEADNTMLNSWLDLYVDHFSDKSLGTFHLADIEEAIKCMF